MTLFKNIIPLFVTLTVAGNTCAYAQHSSQERSDLTIMVRQVEQMQNMIRLMDQSVDVRASRYYFDYQRLNADLQKIRTGINDYLTPKRAQPRDPVPLLGEYVQENRSQP